MVELNFTDPSDGQPVDPTGWQRKTFDYVRSGTSDYRETEPKDELFEDHLKGN